MKGKPGKTVTSGFGDEPGRPVIDYGLCTSCGLCVKVCKSFTVVERGEGPVIDQDNGLGCIACGQCMLACPTGAISVTGRGIQAGDAFEIPPEGKRADPGSLEALLLSRRSVREYSPTPLGKDIVERVISLASSAPMGIPPSDVGIVAVLGGDRVQELAGDVVSVFSRWQTFFNPLMLGLMRPFFKKGEYESFKDFVLPATKLMIDARKDKSDLLFYHAPTVLLFHQSPYADPVDGYIAATYAMIAAQSLGLGTCMIGTVSFVFDREKKLKMKWDIPADDKVCIAMIMGRPALRYRRAIKRRFASVKYV